MSETITIPSLKAVLGGTAINEQNIVSLQINYTATGGTFSISILAGSIGNISENMQISLPYGRIATVKNVGRSNSPAGILDVISGPITVPAATLPARVGIPGNVFAFAASLASQFGISASWQAFNPLVRSFIFSGIALSGIQQLASIILGEVLVRSGGVTVVTPGVAPGPQFKVPKADIVSVNQAIDYSLDFPNTLNPALSGAQLTPEGNYVYDSDHAQKQAKTTVNAGSPGLQGSTDFIPIPDGWLVDGDYEEWTPPSTTDATNPNSTVTNGRYWKDFPSPINPGMRRGITSFTRLIKQINIPKNVSPFVGSPVTGDTLNTFAFDQPDSNGGIYGFTSGDAPTPDPIVDADIVGTTFFDIISHQYYTFPNAIVLIPNGPGGNFSGDAAANFYSIVMELWTFPKVNPKVFGVGNPVNPFGLPSDVIVVNPPMSSFITGDPNTLFQYFHAYMQNYRLINSPRLRTTLSCVFRGLIPQPGDSLLIQSGVQKPTCGRIQTCSLNLGRSGLVLNITAEVYQFVGGLSTKYPEIWSGI